MRNSKIFIRPLEIEDMTSFYHAIRDDEIRYMTGTKAIHSMEELRKYYYHTIKDDSRRDMAICLHESRELIGDFSVMDIDGQNRKAGFRIALHDPRYFGQGYGTEAVGLALDYAFGDLGLNRLQLEVYSHNPRAIRAYEKAGFKKEGVLRESLLVDGTYSDEVIMAMLRKEYEQLKRG